MSDDEAEGPAGENGGEAVDTGLDADGYHVVTSNRGKFQAQLNPLQLKLQEEKRKCVIIRMLARFLLRTMLLH